jgi:hypothetical protein
VLGFVGQIEHEEPLPRKGEPMKPPKGVEDPPRGGGLDAADLCGLETSPPGSRSARRMRDSQAA